MTLLPHRLPDDVRAAAGDQIAAETFSIAAQIVADVQARGDAAAREYGQRFGEFTADGSMWVTREQLADAFAGLAPEDQTLLRDVAGRIEAFAAAQRDSLREFSLEVPGGVARQRLAPVERAGCYAPGGRATLPSSLLMTAVTARTAGVRTVVAASPCPGPIVLGAAHVAGVDGMLALGGAQAIAALAFGSGDRPACDVVVGPGNAFVTAAKQIVQGRVGIDLPAGPSELCVLADETADAALVAADLLAQAEHDVDARPWLLTCDAALQRAVEHELARQLDVLPTADVARVALSRGGSVLCRDLDEAVAVCDRLAPEHLQLCTADAQALGERLQHYGALFLGRAGAEVLGDYGAGPNHVLPTGGAARFTGGLSVFSFLRVRTWLQLDGDASPLLRDAARLADHEGLPGHAAAARKRLPADR